MKKTTKNNIRMMCAVLLVFGLISATIAIISSSTTSTGSGLRVVAGENFWGDIARQIGGNRVRVTSILSDPAVDPHLYESNATNAASVTKADVVIQNGLGYDAFLTKLLNTATRPDRQVITVADIVDVRGNDANPHIWYDLEKIPTVARAIEVSFVAKDPQHSSEYANNLKKFIDSLKPLQASLDVLRAKYAGTPVAYTEPVPAYLLRAANLTALTPDGFSRAIEDGNDPSPSDTQKMDDLITNHEVKVLLYNPQATSSITEHIKQLANESGVPIVEMTETMPPHKTYQSWQQDQLNRLLKALES